jgi:hypothetical protein
LAKVTLANQAAAEAGPYFWKFFTRTDFGNQVVARSQVGSTVKELVAADNASLLLKIASYESYRSDNGKTTH